MRLENRKVFVWYPRKHLDIRSFNKTLLYLLCLRYYSKKFLSLWPLDEAIIEDQDSRQGDKLGVSSITSPGEEIKT